MVWNRGSGPGRLPRWVDQLVEEGATQVTNSKIPGSDEPEEGSVQSVMDLEEDLDEEVGRSSTEQLESLTNSARSHSFLCQKQTVNQRVFRHELLLGAVETRLLWELSSLLARDELSPRAREM